MVYRNDSGNKNENMNMYSRRTRGGGAPWGGDLAPITNLEVAMRVLDLVLVPHTGNIPVGNQCPLRHGSPRLGPHPLLPWKVLALGGRRLCFPPRNRPPAGRQLGRGTNDCTTALCHGEYSQVSGLIDSHVSRSEKANTNTKQTTEVSC